MFLNVSERKNIDGERCPSRDEGGTFVFLLTCVKKRGNLILLATCFIVRQVKRNKSISGGIFSFIYGTLPMAGRELQRFVVQICSELDDVFVF